MLGEISSLESRTVTKLALILWSDQMFGGAERRFLRLAFHLAKTHKLNVTVFCFKHALTAIEALGLEAKYVSFCYLDFQDVSQSKGKFGKLLSLLLLPFKLRKGRYDHVFYATNPDVVTYYLSHFSSVLPPISVAMVDLTYRQNTTRSNRLCTRRTIHKAFSVDCLSPAVKDSYQGSFNDKDEHKIKIAPCSFTDFSKVKLAQERDIDVVLLGRFTRYKGHELLEPIVKELAGCNIHICGAGPLEINIPGAKIYQSSDPFDVLSRSKISLSLQQFGNYPSQVVLESMASGCVVVATDLGETRLFLDESCAILIDYDSTQLLSAIKLLLSDNKKRKRLSERAIEKVHREQSIERYALYFMNSVLEDESKKDLDDLGHEESNTHHNRP